MLIFSISSNPGRFGTYLYNLFFARLGLDYIYKTLKVESNVDLIRLFELYSNIDDFYGMSISMPFKKEAALFFKTRGICQGLEVLSDIPSVNTICKTNCGIKSYSTDVGFIAKFSKRIDVGCPVYIYGDGSIGHLASAYMTRHGYSCHLIRRGNLGQFINQISSHEKVAFLNCTPSIIEDLGLCNITKLEILDVPVRLEHPLQGIKNVMTGLDCAFIQFQYQFNIYTGLKLNLEEIKEAFYERS